MAKLGKIFLSVCVCVTGRLCSRQDVLPESPAPQPRLQAPEGEPVQAGPSGEKTDRGRLESPSLSLPTRRGDRLAHGAGQQGPRDQLNVLYQAGWLKKWTWIVVLKRQEGGQMPKWHNFYYWTQTKKNPPFVRLTAFFRVYGNSLPKRWFLSALRPKIKYWHFGYQCDHLLVSRKLLFWLFLRGPAPL